MAIHTILFTTFSLILLLSLSATATDIVDDFCVADLTLPKGPTGYPCRNPSTLTADDFVYSGLAVPANTSNVFGLGLTVAFDGSFPALNGLGLSMGRLDIAVNGVVPVHTHRQSEVLILIKGSIIAGFIAADNTVYYKQLKKVGEMMMFPPSLLHFQVNIGKEQALAFTSLNSANPGFQIVSNSLFGSDLPTHLVNKISLVDVRQVKALKRILGGTN